MTMLTSQVMQRMVETNHSLVLQTLEEEAAEGDLELGAEATLVLPEGMRI
jgi:hypothetical protein